MKQYVIVRSTKEMDVQETIVEALSLDDAMEMVRGQYAEKLQVGETFFIFPFIGQLLFDEHHRVIFPPGEMASIGRL
jgi:hypothetical protein